ncbi:MAG: preprotein translocase subunit SecE [Actinomycetota bacterium]|jgi:preprotein translocase subunit SecE
MTEENEKASEDLVEKAKADGAKVKSPIGKARLFLRQVVQELSKVTSPTRKELFNYTGVVLGFVAVVMAIISGLDWIFFNVVSFVFAG